LEIIKDRLAYYLPVSFAFGDEFQGEESETWVFHPTLLFIFSFGNNFEITPSAKVLIPLNYEDADPLIAFNLGTGLSTNLNRWVLRPEIGYLFNPGKEGFLSQFSIGLTLYH